MRVSRENESLLVKVRNRKPTEFDLSEFFGSVVTRDGYYTREIKMEISISKEAFNIKISLLTSKLNIELREKIVRCEALHCMVQRSRHKENRGENIWKGSKYDIGEGGSNEEHKMVKESNY